MISTIFLDLDDVLVDFDRGLSYLYASPYEQLMKKRAGAWCLCKALEITPEQLHQDVDAEGPEWWARLPTLPWAYTLLNWARAYAPNVGILTSPGLFKHSRQGKLDWFEKQDLPVSFILTDNKQSYAGPTALLVDDKPENVGEFIKAGGQAMLFPSFGNCLADKRVTFICDNYSVGEYLTNGIQLYKC